MERKKMVKIIDRLATISGSVCMATLVLTVVVCVYNKNVDWFFLQITGITIFVFGILVAIRLYIGPNV